mgnify:CR=1 FL=1
MLSIIRNGGLKVDMIYELTKFNCKPGAHFLLAEIDSKIGINIRDNNFGKLEGYWLSEHGILNQVIVLRSFNDLSHYNSLSDKLSRNPRWYQEYLKSVDDLIVGTERSLLKAFLPFKAPESGGNIYEYRCYTTKNGKAEPWSKLFSAAMPIRKKYGSPICAWITEFGNSNEVSHLWCFKSLEERLASRALAAADKEWQKFARNGGKLLCSMSSSVIIPHTQSPLK